MCIYIQLPKDLWFWKAAPIQEEICSLYNLMWMGPGCLSSKVSTDIKHNIHYILTYPGHRLEGIPNSLLSLGQIWSAQAAHVYHRVEKIHDIYSTRKPFSAQSSQCNYLLKHAIVCKKSGIKSYQVIAQQLELSIYQISLPNGVIFWSRYYNILTVLVKQACDFYRMCQPANFLF